MSASTPVHPNRQTSTTLATKTGGGAHGRDPRRSSARRMTVGALDATINGSPMHEGYASAIVPAGWNFTLSRHECR
jgi:hypothetical protein